MQFVNNVFATLAIHHGMLIHVYYLTPLEIANVVKWIKAIEMCCIIIPVLIKLSVCISILRLVSNAQRSVTIAIALLMATLSLTGLVTFLVEGMQCLPLRKLWEPMVPGKCMTMETANWVLVAYGSKSAYHPIIRQPAKQHCRSRLHHHRLHLRHRTHPHPPQAPNGQNNKGRPLPPPGTCACSR